MRIGDLPRARKPAGHRGGPALRALLVALTIGLLPAGWLIWPSLQANEDSTERAVAAAVPLETTPAEPSVLEPPQAAPVQLAEVEPAVPDGHELLFGPPMNASIEPDFTGSNGPSAGAPEPPAPEAQAAPQEAAAAPASLASAGSGEEAPLAAEEPPPAEGLIDLNTGSLEELNSLDGGGRIGRAIIRGRPYASVEELVTKKILRRSVYETIQDQVTVR
jgi:hypothetical protein